MQARREALTESPLETQAKLLLDLEDGEIMRIGGNEPVRVDVRLISASNREEAAKVLCIGERTLYRKLKKYEIE